MVVAALHSFRPQSMKHECFKNGAACALSAYGMCFNATIRSPKIHMDTFLSSLRMKLCKTLLTFNINLLACDFLDS